jgi:tetratricopeptide (TPR) repeat protein
VQGRGRFENRGGRDERRDDREPIRRLPIPDDVTGQEIDPSVRQELMSLPKTLAEDVARNLVMVARLLDDEPEQAYAYSRIALRLASRVAAVREAAGFASYASERYAEALAEFRATRRMTGTVDLWPVMADCERGLGRPERALEMAGAPEVHKLDKAGQVEMRLVAAGARQDMGQAEAAVVTLQSSELAANAIHPWTARLRYAYADALLTVGREGEAREWFAKAVEADHNGTTDASDRLAQLDGVAFVDAFDAEDADDADGATGAETHGPSDDEPVDASTDAPVDAAVVVEAIDDGLTDEVVVDTEDAEDRDDAEDAEDAEETAQDTEDSDEEDDQADADADDEEDDANDTDAESDDADDADDDAEGDDDAKVSEADAESGEPSSFLDSPFRAPAHPERDDD